jgi:hypothetical protein
MTHSTLWPPERDGAVERWFREEVVPAAIAMRANPDRGIPQGESLKRSVRSTRSD